MLTDEPVGGVVRRVQQFHAQFVEGDFGGVVGMGDHLGRPR